MKKVLFIFFISLSNYSYSLEKLDDCYSVSYGNPIAENKITSYYSFSCPHCVALFREEFIDLKKQCMDTEKVYFTFHPIPADLLTVQGMVCLENLSDVKKQIFLEALLAEVDLADQEYSAILMKKAMEILGHPVPLLTDREYLSKTNAFNAAYKFVKQEDSISEVPTVEVNGILYKKEIPSKDFIKGIITK